jgi:hypothetical protein
MSSTKVLLLSKKVHSPIRVRAARALSRACGARQLPSPAIRNISMACERSPDASRIAAYSANADARTTEAPSARPRRVSRAAFSLHCDRQLHAIRTRIGTGSSEFMATGREILGGAFSEISVIAFSVSNMRRVRRHLRAGDVLQELPRRMRAVDATDETLSRL